MLTSSPQTSSDTELSAAIMCILCSELSDWTDFCDGPRRYASICVGPFLPGLLFSGTSWSGPTHLVEGLVSPVQSLYKPGDSKMAPPLSPFWKAGACLGTPFWYRLGHDYV